MTWLLAAGPIAAIVIFGLIAFQDIATQIQAVLP